MLQNPVLNKVYVINRTDSDLIALDTDSGFVSANRRFEYRLNDAHLFVTSDGSKVYVSVPDARRIFELNSITLAVQNEVILENPITSFVIGSDDRIYGSWFNDDISQEQLIQIDLTTGSRQGVATSSSNPNGYHATTFRLSHDGNSVYILQQGISGVGLGAVDRFDVVPGSLPVFNANYYDSVGGHDLLVDTANNRIYRAPLEVWDIVTDSRIFFNLAAAGGVALTHIQGSNFIWGGDSQFYHGIITRANKTTGEITRTIPIGQSNSDLNEGTLIHQALEVTPNGHVVYGKSDWRGDGGGIDGYDYFLGFIDFAGAPIYTPANDIPWTPSGVTASYNTGPDVDVTWDPSSRATQYRVYRSSINDSATAVEVGTTTATTYSDATAPVGEISYFWVRAENASGLSVFSLSDEGSVDSPPPAPTDFAASDGPQGIFLERVHTTWTLHPLVNSGTRIYRSTTDNFNTATEIGFSGVFTEFYTDLTPIQSQVYYYWARFENNFGLSPPSASDSGYAGDFAPPAAAPTNVMATDAASPLNVQITWTEEEDARVYEVLRHTSNDVGAATVLGSTSQTSFTDTTGTPQVVYFYWVRGKNTAGSGPESVPDTGSKAQLTAPDSVAATDETYINYVQISWGSSLGATSYEVYRNTVNDSGAATLIRTTSNTSPIQDYDVIPLSTYFYWVKAVNAEGSSPFSASDEGSADIREPQRVYATRDLYTDKIRVTWNSVKGCTIYRVFRDDVEIGMTTGGVLRYEDTTADPGMFYNYRVKAQLPSGTLTDFSPITQSGRRATDPLDGTFIPVTDPRQLIFDTVRNRLYITTEDGVVEVYDLDSNLALAGWNTDGALDGADITADNLQLMIAQGRNPEDGSGLGLVQTINLDTGAMMDYDFPLSFGETTGPYDVSILNGGQALITGMSAGSGSQPPLRKLDLGTGVVSNLPHNFNPRSFFSRTPDRTRALIQEGGSSSGEFRTYDVAGDQFSSATLANAFQRRGDISPDGSLLAMYVQPNLEVRLTTDGSVFQTINDLDSGIAFDPTRPVLFAVDEETDSVRCFETNVWQEAANIDLGRPIGFSGERFGEGHIVISPDGARLGVTFEEGVLLLNPTPVLTAPLAPTNLAASDQTTTAGVALTWTAAANAQSYTVYRGVVDDSSMASMVANSVGGTTYTDTTAVPGIVYFYWLKAVNLFGESAFSTSDAGERKLAPPAGFGASNSLTDKVSLTWTASLGADSYTIRRSDQEDIGASTVLASGIAAVAYDDATPDPGMNYYYWIEAVNSRGVSDRAGSVVGSRKLMTPANVALDDQNPAQIVISWDATIGAMTYEVFRSTVDGQQGGSLGTTASTSFNDSTATPGQLYYWSVRAIADNNMSDLSAQVSGRRRFAAPATFNASQTLVGSVDLTWSGVVGQIGGFEIRRSTTNDFGTSSLVIEPAAAATSASDSTAPQGVPLFYWIRAVSPTTTGDWAAGEGFSRTETFGQFTDRHGLAGEDAAAGADPDGDFFTNFEEWAQGAADPTSAVSTPPLIAQIQNISGTDYLTVCYLRFIGGVEAGAVYNHVDVVYTSEGASNPAGPWDQSPTAAPVSDGLTAPPNGYEWGSVRLPFSADANVEGFVRLILNPPSP